MLVVMHYHTLLSSISSSNMLHVHLVRLPVDILMV